MIKWILVAGSISQAQHCDVTLKPDERDCKSGEAICSYTRQSDEFLTVCEGYEAVQDVSITIEDWDQHESFNLTITNRNDANFVISISDTVFFDLHNVRKQRFEINAQYVTLQLAASTKTAKLTEVDFEVRWVTNPHEECEKTCESGLCCHISGTCYNARDKCNGVWDCHDGEDEIGCHRRSVQCTSSQIMCPRVHGSVYDGNNTTPVCIPLEYICDGIEDCPVCPVCHSVDEINCSDCANGAVLCSGESPQRCIAERKVCNGQNDCNDGSDEINCPIMEERKVLTAAVVGSLGCCVLFVIALGCTRRLLYVQSINSCSRARRNLQNLASILQVREAPPTYEAAMGYEPSLMNRQSRNRPWRLTRHGLRRESRRARRRRLPENQNDTSSIDLTSVLQEDNQIPRTESLESLESTPRESTSNITSPEPAHITPSNPSQHVATVEPPVLHVPPVSVSASNMHELATPDSSTHQVRNEEEDRKSISSQH